MKVTAVNLTEKEYILPGNRTCAGCGLSLAYRHALKALGDNTIVTMPASCLTVLHGMYPISSVLVPSLNNVFGGTGAAASGIVAARKALRKPEVTVVGFAGDGGTHDIGIQALSGAAERGSDFIYACYDNEGYMNTGTQRSSSTPLGALTATTPILGKQQHQKDMPLIMEAHRIPYVATTSATYPDDLYLKFGRAKEIKGTRFIYISTPCPPGWSFPARETVRIGKLAVETGMVVLYEIENGVFHLTSESKRIAQRGYLKPIREYVSRQGRFKDITEEQLVELQRWVDQRWQEYLGRDSDS